MAAKKNVQRFRVVGALEVHGTQPGDEFDVDLNDTPYDFDVLVASGAVERVDARAAKADDGT